MNRKKELILAIDYGKYLAFVLATIFVIVSQFVTGRLWLIAAFTLYTVGFAFLFIGLVVHTVEIYNADKLVKNQNMKALSPSDTEKEQLGEAESALRDKNVEVVSLKNEKVSTVLCSILTGLMTLFTFAVLVLYTISVF